MPYKLSEVISVIDELLITDDKLDSGLYGTVYAATYDGKPCMVKEMHPYLNQGT